jgi:3-deoxy-D-manno-octulosonic-acid transferase
LFGNRIPAFCISAIFRPGQIFFKPYGGLFRKILERFSSIYVQNEESFQLLSRIALPQVVVSGDTRFDRVAQLPHMPIENPIVNSFCSVSPTLVAGSTWSGDEKVLVDWLRAFPNWNLMIVPHEVSDSNVNRLVTVFGPEAMALSVAVGQSSASSCRVLIVDSVGLLSRLYRFATVSYIGGGFGTGIHNTLEAAVYGKPVVFGPNYQRFKEAHDLIDRGAAHSIGSAAEMISLFKRWQTQPEEIQIAGRAAEAYVASNAGATTTIVQGICAHL